MTERSSLAANAIDRVLRPVIRLALVFGLKYQDFDAIVRRLLISEAGRSIRKTSEEAQGKTRSGAKRKLRINVSQLSVATGLSRVDIKERTAAEPMVLPETEMSYTAKTFTLWMQHANDEPALRTVPIVGPDDTISFSTLARMATRGNVHHRAVLSELIRLKMAEQEGDQVSLLATAFVPTSDEQTMLAFLADNTRDHLNAAVSNVSGNAPPFLERVVFSQGIAERDCIAAMNTMRTGWARAHASLVPQLNKAVDNLKADAPFRIRLGVYAYYEPWDPEDPSSEQQDEEPE
jgi:hypothetical protein